MHADAALFNLEYERWLGEHSKVVARLRAAAEEHRPDGELRAYVDEAAAHYGDWAQLPGLASDYVTALGVDEPPVRPVD